MPQFDFRSRGCWIVVLLIWNNNLMGMMLKLVWRNSTAVTGSNPREVHRLQSNFVAFNKSWNLSLNRLCKIPSRWTLLQPAQIWLRPLASMQGWDLNPLQQLPLSTHVTKLQWPNDSYLVCSTSYEHLIAKKWWSIYLSSRMCCPQQLSTVESA